MCSSSYKFCVSSNEFNGFLLNLPYRAHWGLGSSPGYMTVWIRKPRSLQSYQLRQFIEKDYQPSIQSLVLIPLANLQVANQVLAGHTMPVNFRRSYPVAGVQMNCTRWTWSQRIEEGPRWTASWAHRGNFWKRVLLGSEFCHVLVNRRI